MNWNKDDLVYVQCAKCAHFVDPNEPADIAQYDVAPYVHLDDGEKEHDHDAQPGPTAMPLREWKRLHPELFQKGLDGKIGPNSAHFGARRTSLLKSAEAPMGD